MGLKDKRGYSEMAKHTKKVGIVGKYGTRYGASVRKLVKKIEIMAKSRYMCPFCGKTSVRRQAVGIWKCSACKKVMAGGAWQLATAPAVTVRASIARLRKIQEAGKHDA